MSRLRNGAGAQKAYNRISDKARLRYRTQRNLDANLDGRSYDDATITGAITMPIKANSPVGTNNHENNKNSVVRIDPSNNFPCYISPYDETVDSSGNKTAVFSEAEKQKVNDMLPFVCMSGQTNIANVQSGLEVTMESYGPFALNNLRVKTTYSQVRNSESIGGDESVADKFKSGDTKPVE